MAALALALALALVWALAWAWAWAWAWFDFGFGLAFVPSFPRRRESLWSLLFASCMTQAKARAQSASRRRGNDGIKAKCEEQNEKQKKTGGLSPPAFS
ncbi:hypothetical protein [Stenotrophomonas sp.]|uniref:hypothetical protein n=1 Tax=Stenotrophomonas sp. TaxID=69392 RepID=UPI0028A9FB4A|nr:hypothetical protein [Stenotrophomonas sp.]